MNNTSGTREQITNGVAAYATNPTKGEETSSTEQELMAILLERIENGSLDLATTVRRFHREAPEATKSRVGPGTNATIPPEDVERILGPHDLEAIATEAGLPKEEVAFELAKVLPVIIDKFTPGGWLPETEIAKQAAGDLKAKIA